jgi:NAD(P)H-dependent FMN reductase
MAEFVRLCVIAGSTRPGRRSPEVARWVATRAAASGAFTVRVVDLGELGLPLFDEPEHPRHRRYVHAHTREWSAVVEASDAFVIVTPEYNHGYPSGLKNALDFLYDEWRDKAVGLVCFGGVSAGLRAVQQLKTVLLELRMHPVHEGVAIPFHIEHFDTEGHFQPTDRFEGALSSMLAAVQQEESRLSAVRASGK